MNDNNERVSGADVVKLLRAGYKKEEIPPDMTKADVKRMIAMGMVRRMDKKRKHIFWIMFGVLIAIHGGINAIVCKQLGIHIRSGIPLSSGILIIMLSKLVAFWASTSPSEMNKNAIIGGRWDWVALCMIPATILAYIYMNIFLAEAWDKRALYPFAAFVVCPATYYILAHSGRDGRGVFVRFWRTLRGIHSVR